VSPPFPGLHAAFGYRLPFERRMELLRDAGFTTTALWWEERRPEIRAMRDRAPDMVRAQGLELDNIHVPYHACNDLWADSNLRTDPALDLHRGWIDDCHRHNVDRMVMHVTLGVERVPPPSERALNTFRRLIDHADRRGVVLAIENTHCPGHVAWLLDRLRSRALGLCFDAAHDTLYSAQPLALLRAFGRRLEILHLADIYRRRDAHLVPGYGRLDLAALMGALPSRVTRFSTLQESVARPRREPVQSFLERVSDAAREWSRGNVPNRTPDKKEINRWTIPNPS